MERVIIYGNHNKATVVINNVDLELLEQQRIELLKDADRLESGKHDGIINFLNEIFDKYEYMKKENEHLLSHVLFGEEACRIYDDYGIGGLIFAIKETDFDSFAIHHFQGDIFDLMAQMDGWNYFVWITEEEYDKLK